MSKIINLGKTIKIISKILNPTMYKKRRKAIGRVVFGAIHADRLMITRHGRATPLLWNSYDDTEICGKRVQFEKALLSLLKSIISLSTKVIVFADRGFSNTSFFKFIEGELGWDYVIRIKNNIKNHKDYVVKLYSSRFTCEENFRDLKDDRFGSGFKETIVTTKERRDRLIMIHALTVIILTILGAVGEKLRYDRHLRANTVKYRTHSLYRNHECICIAVRPNIYVTP